METTITLYKSKSGIIKLNLDKKQKTIWVNQDQISRLFNIDQSVISRHIKNIFQDNEINKKRNMQKMHIANSDKKVTYYSLDVVLGVGYRTNSSKAILFRQWATKILNQYITQGYAINRSLIKSNYELFQKTISEVKSLLPEKSSVEASGILELIKVFADTWFSLDAYDKSKLPTKGTTIKKVDLSADELINDIQTLKTQLIKKQQATELFAKERQAGNIQNIFRGIYQSFRGIEAYPTIEAKAANLLYFVIKDHPFVDGNKRSGAFTFLWFLQKAGLLNTIKISPELITTITIMVAESKMEDREKMIGIILLVLQQ